MVEPRTLNLVCELRLSSSLLVNVYQTQSLLQDSVLHSPAPHRVEGDVDIFVAPSDQPQVLMLPSFSAELGFLLL